VAAFGAAAARAVKAGYDGVQIHAAHGYLLSQFLSPFFNQRTDAYGGSLQNRARLLMQVVRHVREVVGETVPVFAKLNSDDLLPGGLSSTEALEVCAMLQDTGIDAIELSGGTTLALLMNKPENSYAQTGEARLYWRQAAEQYKARISVPLMLVGGIRSLKAAEELVASGVTDYVSLSRPLIRQPDLVNRWRSEESAEAACISCDACLMAGVMGQGVHCAHVAA
jgi:2,4-dienoyl-CoA reductase-like NADH-dependent reductase (Old Yellow Enzyme family)